MSANFIEGTKLLSKNYFYNSKMTVVTYQDVFESDASYGKLPASVFKENEPSSDKKSMNWVKLGEQLIQKNMRKLEWHYDD